MANARRPIRYLVILHLAVWASLVALWTAYLFVTWEQPGSLSSGQVMLAGIATAFGPFATVFLQLTSMPNGGEFFSWALALGLTIPLLGVICVSFTTTTRWMRITCVALYVFLLLAWIRAGIMQVGDCLT